ncbi:hypothetical protein EW145_g2459 [Phellinidium pouzarii]|uniref:RING-type E3 ubiquitin transferase n=1 Tax=Phellinidium pouzarii TaxID=167371 RepID=A0A4S4LB79_9AGAM|nr:hypothetical protein EW145_g2459 [Phellinidium pouzarii]
MSQRPKTSNVRGVCKYFRLKRGCFHGDNCKFLHSEGETLSPYDKTYRQVFAKGFCKHGDKCWFRHARNTSAATAFEIGASNVHSDSLSEEIGEEDALCCICQEKPVTYGLLEKCSHIYCLQCLRDWRDPADKSQDIINSGNTKKCPYCRASSNFVTPSSIFYPSEDPRKTATITHYKASMARVPCKYFGKFGSGRSSCPFGINCFYQHKDVDSTPYVFPQSTDHYTSRLRSQLHSGRAPFIPISPFSRSIRSDIAQTLADRFRLLLESLRPPPNASNVRFSEAEILDRLLDIVLRNFENNLTTSAFRSTSDDQAEIPMSGSDPSFLSALENIYTSFSASSSSSLPLTRAFMDSNISLDEVNDTSMGSAHGPFQTSDSETQRSFTPRTSVGLDTEGFVTDSFDAMAVPLSQTPPQPFSVRTSDASPGELDQPYIITIDSDAESEPDIEVLSTEPLDDSMTLHESLISPGQAEVEVCRSHATTVGSEDRDFHDHELRSKVEVRRESASRRTKTFNGVISCSGRRTGGQSFVTDGRGRVVATDDGAAADSISLAFWDPAISVTSPLPTSDAVGVEVGDGHVESE